MSLSPIITNSEPKEELSSNSVDRVKEGLVTVGEGVTSDDLNGNLKEGASTYNSFF